MRTVLASLLLVACASRAIPAAKDPPLATLCACRSICAPDAYEWRLTYQGPPPVDDGGECTCRSR